MTPAYINCGGRILSFEKPRVMGILNITPDSFYSSSRYTLEDAWLFRAEQMIQEGADILDTGGVSTRAGSNMPDTDTELKRVIPAIESLRRNFPEVPVSVDTFRAKVAGEAVSAGACLINDISAGSLDADMFLEVARLNAPYILMHMQGTPANMQQKPEYKQVIPEIILFLAEKAARLRSMGVNDIIVDPGFGFGKTMEQNYELLFSSALFTRLFPIVMAGISRKSMICRKLNIQPDAALNGTTILNTYSFLSGVSLFRVHDVKQACEIIRLLEH